MQMTSVSSSFISAIGAEEVPGTEDSLTVQIQFKDGAVFEYSDVSAGDYKALLEAPSVGKYFHAYFKKTYDGVRV